MSHRFFLVGFLLIGILSLFPARTVWADCGSVPFYAPTISELSFNLVDASFDTVVHSIEGLKTGKKKIVEVSFDPLKVTVFEPKQRALILHNGEEQILLLSTDQRASERSAILEVIPLPSESTVQLGSFETFEKAQKLMVEKRMWAMAHGGLRAGIVSVPKQAGRIHFAKKMGAHDVTVAQVLDSDGFVEFFQGYLGDKYGTENAPIRPEFVDIIDGYLGENFRWFAFDVIALDESDNSREPIQYRFRTDRVFYPMRISNLERGETEVEMLVFTPMGITRFGGLEEKHFDRRKSVEATTAEVEGLAQDWNGFFGTAEDLKIDQWSIRGDISKFERDVWVW